MEVFFSKQFLKVYNNLKDEDLNKIDDFREHIEEKGFIGLPGRNKKSDNVKENSPTYDNDVNFAQKNHLWHYHIGITKYSKINGFGKYTSEFVLHYQRYNDHINIVKLDNHSPFILPLVNDLK